MLKLSKEMRDQITGFLGNITVPVSQASSFISVIQCLNGLEEIKEDAPAKEKTSRK